MKKRIIVGIVAGVIALILSLIFFSIAIKLMFFP